METIGDGKSKSKNAKSEKINVKLNKSVINENNKSESNKSESKKIKNSDNSVTFIIVEKNGSLSRVAILKGIDEETDKEILKVLKESPKWKSGEKEGQKVRCLIPLFITINGSK